MSKNRACIEQSIKMAKKKCTKKTNLLVYEKDYVESCKKTDAAYVPRIPCPKAKHIRVCTGAELKKMCPPVTCGCVPGPPESVMHKLSKLIFFGIKSAIAAGVIYTTVKMGVWGDSCETHSLYRDICHLFQVEEEIKSKSESRTCDQNKELFQSIYQDCCDKPFVDHERAAHKFQTAYNNMVFAVFSGIAGFPMNIVRGFQNKKCDGKGEQIVDDLNEDFSGPYDTIGGNEKCPEEEIVQKAAVVKEENVCVCD